jgi:hypothetical protein
MAFGAGGGRFFGLVLFVESPVAVAAVCVQRLGVVLEL